MSAWKAEMRVQGEWCSNALRFATETEAKAYALNLFSRWTQPDDWRAVPCDDVPNYTADDSGRTTPIEKPLTVNDLIEEQHRIAAELGESEEDES